MKIACTIALLAASLNAVHGQVPVWGQCGGNGYTGSTVCAAGSTCFTFNEWYSQCHPSVDAPPSAAPTTAPTKAPTAASTTAPTAAPTTAPTKAPTAASTTAPTAAPTTAPTKAPTAAPTTAPTKAPTAAPTTAPTQAPTVAPTSAPSSGGPPPITNNGTFAALNDPTIIAWDVLNEAVKDNGSDLKHDVFYNVLGPNYITQIFTLARKYAPKGVKLFYNDYGCETPGAKANKCFEVVSGLKSKGLIDGIGFQTHLSTSTNLNGQAALFKRYSDI
ncbi:hypothetical protein AeMF1_014848, partial [Aphanomyces euteiches]